MRTISVVGLDPSLQNLGIARARIDVETFEITLDSLSLVETEPGKNKTVRKNSDDLERARLLFAGLEAACVGVTTAFCEVPVGSQSARAMASYGICVGVLASCSAPLVQLTPYEVKIAALNCKTASKEEMIAWAVGLYPKAPWLRRAGKLLNKNEHLADAVATIHAGIRTAEFQSMLRMVRTTQASVA